MFDSELIAKGYSVMIRDIAKDAGLKQVEIEGASEVETDDVPGHKLVWSVFRHRHGPSIRGATRVRDRMMALRPELEIPPPRVLIESWPQWRWIAAGDQLLRLSPARFEKALEYLREQLLLAADDASKEASKKLHSIKPA